MVKPALALLQFDLRQVVRQPADLLQPPLFMVLILAVYGFLTEGSTGMLGGLVLYWLILLLSLFLPFRRVIETDHRDGTLDLVLGSGMPAELVFLVKAAGYWLMHAVPLMMLFPLVQLILPVPGESFIPLCLVSLQLSLLLVLGAALLVGSHRAGLLLYILLLPLALPALIFATAASMPGAGASALWFLGGITVLTLAVVPWAGGAALRGAVQE